MPNISVRVSGPIVRVLVDYLLLTGYNEDCFVLGIFTSRFTDISGHPSDCIDGTYN